MKVTRLRRDSFDTEVTVIPAQPGFSVVEPACGGFDDRITGVHLIPVIAWVIHPDEFFNPKDFTLSAFPISVGGVARSWDDNSGIRCPDGRTFFSNGQCWFDVDEDERLIAYFNELRAAERKPAA